MCEHFKSSEIIKILSMGDSTHFLMYMKEFCN